MSAQPAQFTLPFTHYAKLGYFPIPTEGKVPAGGPGWNQIIYTPAEYKALDTSGHNVGLLCSNVVGLDIDVEDDKLARKVESLCRKFLALPKSTPRRIGRAPKALLVMRVAEPMKGWDIKATVGKKHVTLFQLLGQGKQFVIHGTHPDTHKPYTLDKPLPTWGRLPLLEPLAAIELRAALEALFDAEGFHVRSTGSHGGKQSGAFSGPPWTETGMVQAWDAMVKLDPDMSMDEWVQVGFALYDGTCGSEEGLAMWTDWSARGEKYIEGDCARRWRGFRPGRGVTRATLFKNNFPLLGADDGERSEFTQPVEMDAADLFDFDAGEVPWIVSDLMTHGAHLLAGRPKGGKSWVTLDMAYAVGSGGTFMGHQCRKGRVLWIAGEDTKASLSRRMKLRGERPQNISVMTMEALIEEAKKYPSFTFDAWLGKYLEVNKDVVLVIMDTHATIEARWQQEVIEETRKISPVELAYQKSRIYEEIGHSTETCILLVHHTGKLKNNHDLDYHERINMPQTVVAGATASFVLADYPDRDQHDEDDHTRIFALRGRHLLKDTPQAIELIDGRVRPLGDYIVIKQSLAQARVFEVIEGLLEDEEKTTMAEVAKASGMTLRNVAALLGRCKRDGKLEWKNGRKLVIKAGRNGGLSWA